MKIENIFKNFRKGNSVLISENYETDLEPCQGHKCRGFHFQILLCQ